jgi:hypothetical protein
MRYINKKIKKNLPGGFLLKVNPTGKLSKFERGSEYL